MRRRMLKLLFWGASLVFWLASGFMMLESWERYSTRHDALFRKASPILSQAEMRDMEIYNATFTGSPRPPEEVLLKYPSLQSLENASDDQLAALATQWEGIIFHCSLEGDILNRHVAQHAPIAQQLAIATEQVERVMDILPPDNLDYRRDILFRMERAVNDWRRPQPKLPHMVGCLGPYVDYMIPLSDIPNAGFRFLFHPFRPSEQESPEIHVVVVPWRWEAFFGGFRANYYESEAYPQFPKSEFWTNSRGFRDEEIAVPKPEGVYRIICIGGSTTLEGPRNDLTYPKMLQHKLRKHFQTEAIEVINCGVDGGTIRGQAFRFDDCLALAPDLVIHYNYVNDAGAIIDETLNETTLDSHWRRTWRGKLAQSKFLTRRCRPLWSLFMPAESDYQKTIETTLMPSLQELHDQSRNVGARFALSSFAYPDIYHIPAIELAWFRSIYWPKQTIQIQWEDYALSADAFNASARAFCDRNNAIYIPVAENIQGGLETFTDHCHMHIPGIQRKSEIMYQHLVDIVAEDFAKPRP